MSEQAEISRISEVLADVSGALGRVSDGTYGRCKLCRASIQHEILTADPLASLCGLCNTTAANGVVDSDVKIDSGMVEHQYGYISGESA